MTIVVKCTTVVSPPQCIKVDIADGERGVRQHVGKTVEIVNGEKCDSQHVGNKVEIVDGEKCGRQHVKRRTFVPVLIWK